MSSLIMTWYEWGVFAGVFIAAAATIYIFFDAQEYPGSQVAKYAKIGVVLGLLLTLPSLYMRLAEPQSLDILANVILAIMNPEEAERLQANLELFAYLGMLGMLLSLGTLAYYYTQKDSDYAPLPNTAPTAYAPPAQASPPAPPEQAPPPAAQSTSYSPPPAASPSPRAIPPTQPIRSEPPPMAWLVARSGSRAGQQYGLQTQQPNIIGRDASRADIIVDDDTVSREHARVRYENGQFVVYDLASTSGTFVNGNMVQRQMLYDNDRIMLGRMEFIFKKAT